MTITRLTPLTFPLALLAVVQGSSVAEGADVGVAPTKLVVVDKVAVAGKAKAVFVAKDAGVAKGAGTDPAQIAVRLDVLYANGSAAGAFVVPAGASNGTDGWLANKAAVAKYVNKAAPDGPTQTKVAVVKPGKLLKLVGKGLGDTPLDILGAGDPAGSVETAYCIENEGETTCHCSTFTGCVHKAIAGGTGAKLTCKTGVANPGCAGVCIQGDGICRAGCGAADDDCVSGCFVDLGLTIEDTCTGLEWEKKTTSVGSGANPADPHDVDNTYQWSATGSAPDGGAHTDFLATLNTPPCFAGHCDWRLPDESGRNVNGMTDPRELETILLSPYVCGTDPCVDPIFGPTGSGYYWSGSTWTGSANDAWVVQLSDGLVVAANKTNPYAVRAVRGSGGGATTSTTVGTTSTTSTTTLATTTTTAPSTTSTSLAPTTTTSSSTTSTTLASGCLQDWGDGTIRDTCTGLQWEQKTTAVGSGANAGDLHDVDNRYAAAGTCSVTTSKLCQPNAAAEAACKAQKAPADWAPVGCEQCTGGEGTCTVGPLAITTVWDWVSQLNAASFAGHTDWRLPSESGCNSCYTGAPSYTCAACSAHELEALLLGPYACGTNPCVDALVGPTQSDNYWSASTYLSGTPNTWSVKFSDGAVDVLGNTSEHHVRAVRAFPIPGGLDTSFGSGGSVTTPIGSSEDVARALVQQVDGKLVAAGYSWNGSNYDVALLRYNPDGSLDGTFGSGGKVTTPIGSGGDWAYALVQQADAKLIATGGSYSGSYYDIALVRYDINGSLDPTFGSAGKVTTPIGGGVSEAYALVQQPDGKVVAAGYSYYGSNFDMALVRYNPDGSLDGTFGSGGIVTTPIGGSAAVYALVLQADGKLVAAGEGNGDVGLVRYNPDGSLDGTFGSGGKVTTPIGSFGEYAQALAQQPDGKLVAAGTSWNGSNWDVAMVRYNPDGSLDATFGSGGKVTTPIGSSDDLAQAVVRQPDGRLVAAGYSYNGNADVALVRYNPDGSLDTTFGGSGKVTTPIGSAADRAYALVQQADGKLVAAGDSWNGSNYDFALVRYQN